MTRLGWLLLATMALAAPAPLTLRDDFSTAAEFLDRWEPLGPWRVTEGRLTIAAGPARQVAAFVAAPLAERLEVSAEVTVIERTAPGGWSTAGLALWLDPANFWQLALVESPDGKRYAELVEMYAGNWQAQTTGATTLRQEVAEGAWDPWAPGQTYRLRLVLADGGLTGEVSEPGGRVRTRLRYVFGATPAVREGRPALTAGGFVVAVDNVAVAVVRPGDRDCPLAVERGAAGSVAILDDRLPGFDRARLENLTTALRQTGFGVTPVSWTHLADRAALDVRWFDALVLTDSVHYSPAARETLLRYLRAGGELVLLGGLAFSEPVWPAAGEWATADQLLEVARRLPPGQVIESFEGDAARRWTRVTDQPDAGSTLTIEPGPHGPCAKFAIRGLTGWDNVTRAVQGLPAAADSLSLRARGGPGTGKLVLEVRETDGSRWITTVDVSEQWQRLVIPDWRFEWWRDSQSAGRGGPGDRLHLERAASVTVGLAISHAPSLKGDQTLWFDDLEVLAAGLPRAELTEPLELPAFSDYEVYRLDTPDAVGWSAIGFAIPGQSRYTRLLPAVDARGRERGAVLGRLDHFRGAFRDSSWLLCGLTGDDVYRRPEFARRLATELRTMVAGETVRAARAAERQPAPAPTLTTPPPHAGFIGKSPDGRHLVYPDGRRFFMLGCNDIGLFDRCAGRMWAGDLYDPALVDLEFRLAAEAGLNVLRYWLQGSFDQRLQAGDTGPVTAIREAARRHGVYLLLDLPGTGYADEAAMVASHKRIAAAFRDEPMVLGYDLRNEPYVTTIGGLRYSGEPVPLQSRDLRPLYPGRVEEKNLQQWLAERPWWLHLPAAMQGEEAVRLVAAWTLWGHYLQRHKLHGSTLVGLGAEVPRAGDEVLVETVDATLDRWLRSQIAAIREVDPNHLITVGHNTALTILPANAQLDFVSHHIYARPTSPESIRENFTTLDRLAARWPDKPITLGEFGYSNGIPLAGGYLDPDSSCVGEIVHWLYALSRGYDGAKKWMLVDWPLAVMRHYGDWNRGLATRIYEERFGLYSYDGTPGGRPKPIVAALRGLREIIDELGPGGELTLGADDGPLNLSYTWRHGGALLVGGTRHDSPELTVAAPRPLVVQVRPTGGGVRLLSSADATVTLRPASFGLPRVREITGAAGQRPLGERLELSVLAGQAVSLGP